MRRTRIIPVESDADLIGHPHVPVGGANGPIVPLTGLVGRWLPALRKAGPRRSSAADSLVAHRSCRHMMGRVALQQGQNAQKRLGQWTAARSDSWLKRRYLWANVSGSETLEICQCCK